MDDSKRIPSPSSKYQVERVIGEGGMKTILRVNDIEIGRDVAMAVMNDPEGPGAKAFLQEALLTARLEHPNIVPVHETGTGLSGEPFFTMKLLSGVDLARILDHLHQGDEEYLRKFPLRRLLEILLKVCDAVAFAHSKGIIHLDLKPDNVQVGEFGEVLVLDWGLSKQIGSKDSPHHPDAAERPKTHVGHVRDMDTTTLNGYIKGTPAYMAPEQALGRNGRKGYRTDVYALGAILYSILTFRPPVAGASSEEILDNAIHSRIIPARNCVPPGRPIPPALEFVAYKAMDRDPNRRYLSVQDFKADIEAYLAGFATRAEDAGLFMQLWLLLRRKRSEALLLASALATIAIFAAYMLVNIYDERVRAETALLGLNAAESKYAGLVARLSKESTREWRLLFEEGFDDKYVDERWSSGAELPFVRDPSGAIVLRAKLREEAGAFLRERLPYDSARLLVDCAFVSQDQKGFFDLFLQSSASGDGFRVELSPNKAAIFKGQGRRLLAETSILLPQGRPFLLLAEILRDSSGASLRLEIDGRQALSVKDSAPPPLNKASSTIGFVATGGELSLRDLKLYALDTPLKAELIDIASRHLNKGNFSTAADLFAELMESSVDPAKRAAAAEGLRLAKLLDQAKSMLPEWRKRLERACPDAKLALSIDTDGLRVELSSRKGVDLTPLKELPVSILRVNCPALSDLSPLASSRLLSLDVSGCRVSDLSPLAKMPLKSLRLDGDPVASLAPLASLASLRHLSARGCGLKSLAEISNLRLAGLDVSDNSLDSLEPLLSMPLETLNCSGNPLKGLEIPNPFALRWLIASNCSLLALPPMRVQSLELLDVSSNSIVSLEPLRGAPLRILRAKANRIESLAPLAECRRLEELSAEWNSIAGLEPLSGLKLKSLRVDGNLVASLAPLRAMDSLDSLSLQANRVKDLSPLSSLFKLSSLDVSANPVERLDSIDSLSLDFLLCGDCPVEAFGKALSFPPRRLFILDRKDLTSEDIAGLSSKLGVGPYAKALERSLSILAAFKRGDSAALRAAAQEVDGRFFTQIPSLFVQADAKRAAEALGAELPDAADPDALEMLSKRFSSSFWTGDGRWLDDGVLAAPDSPRRLLPLTVEWRDLAERD